MRSEREPVGDVLSGTDVPDETQVPEVCQTFVDSVEDVSSGPDARRILGGNALESHVDDSPVRTGVGGTTHRPDIDRTAALRRGPSGVVTTPSRRG